MNCANGRGSGRVNAYLTFRFPGLRNRDPGHARHYKIKRSETLQFANKLNYRFLCIRARASTTPVMGVQATIRFSPLSPQALLTDAYRMTLRRSIVDVTCIGNSDKLLRCPHVSAPKNPSAITPFGKRQPKIVG